MQIISHRGLWKSLDERNTAVAFERSFAKGFGLETDLRDFNGDIYISHDVPINKKSIMRFSEFLDIYNDFKEDLSIALNIKSDGLQLKMKEILEKNDIENYRLFDMSIPDQKITNDYQLKFLTRLSDLEQKPIMHQESKGIWLDSFFSLWYNPALIESYLKNNKEVWIVSPELHNRNYHEMWKDLKSELNITSKNLYLCTDHPLEAKKYFYE